ncbi:MAG TPA: hypothetical protein ENK26_10370 [Gammaproteobacteria bacterium]|nr:hypothetical protein [Gammaproteobacteria bacterium]
MSILARTALLAILLSLASGVQAAVKARLAKSRVTLGQTVTLHIEYEGQTKNNPATRGLSRDFKVLNTRRKVEVDFKDGAIVARTVWDVRLKPKKAGRLTVPPVMIEGESTRPLKLRVVEAAPAKQKAAAKKPSATPKPVNKPVAAPTPPPRPAKKPVAAVKPAPAKKAVATPTPKVVEKPAPVVKTPPPPPVVAKSVPAPSHPPARTAPPVVKPIIPIAKPKPRPIDPSEVFIETRVEPASPYVQQMTIFSMRIYHAIKLLDGELPDPVLNNALVRRLDIDRNETVNRNGRRYKVIERRWAIFPQNAGPMTIEAPVLRAKAPDDSPQGADGEDQSIFDSDPYFAQTPFGKLLGNSRSLELKGENRTIDVRPPPPLKNDGDWWLPAREVVLTERYEPPVDQLKLGDPITRVVSLRVEGLMGAQLPRLPAARVAGANVYPDQVKPRTRENEHGVLGDIVQRFTYVPEQPGELAIPPIQVGWWDVLNDKPRVASAPGKTIKVLDANGHAAKPAPPTAAAPKPRPAAPVAQKKTVQKKAITPPARPASPTAKEPPQPSDSPSSWLWRGLALVFGLLWLATVGVYLKHRRAEEATETDPEPKHASIAREARRDFERACRDNNARDARAALLRWAGSHWPDNPPAGLTGLSRRFDNTEARDAIAELNAHLFHRKRGSWSGERLLRAVGKLPARPVRAARAEGLPELYSSRD